MAKRDKRTRKAIDRPAERHGFDTGGLLGHDATYNVNVTESVALSVDVVFACVRTLADLTSDAQVGEFRGTEKLTDSRLVLRPMASITRRTWLWMLVAIMALYNGAYLWRRFGIAPDGAPYTLEPVAPPRVQWMSSARVLIDGQDARPEDLRWVPRMTFPTMTRDLASLIRLAREAIAAAWAADSYRSDFWQQGGAPQWYVTTDQPLSNGDADSISDRITQKRTTSPGKPLVLGKGAKPATLGTDLAAAGAADATSKLGTSIARYFGMPAWMVNVPSEAGSLTYANASAAGLDLVRYTLQPGYAGPIADAWSDELPGNYLTGRRVVLGLNHLTRGTVLEQSQAYAIATGNAPWMIPSEVRAELGLPPDLGLDENGAPAPALERIAP